MSPSKISLFINTLNQKSNAGFVKVPFNKLTVVILNLLKLQHIVQAYTIKTYYVQVINNPKYRFLPFKPVGVWFKFKELALKSAKYNRLYNGTLIYTTSTKGTTTFNKSHVEGGLPLFYVYEQI